MSTAAQFGEMLRRFVPLSNHDVSEILEDQALSHRRFGEIALSLGWCQPDHVWRAWGAQLAHNPQHVDLDRIGIDNQALAILGSARARQFGVIPVRVLDDQLILAASQPNLDHARNELPQHLSRKLLFVIAPESQIQNAIDRFYPESPAAQVP
jgi:hypothetical protein